MMVSRCQQLSSFFLLVVLASSLISLVTAEKRQYDKNPSWYDRDGSAGNRRMGSNPRDDGDRRGNNGRGDRNDRGDRDEHGEQGSREDHMVHVGRDDHNDHDDHDSHDYELEHSDNDGHNHKGPHYQSTDKTRTHTGTSKNRNGSASIGSHITWFQRIVLAGSSILMVLM